jgi:hypothetical protein
MKTKITQFIPALVALAFIGFRYLSVWCIFTTRVCYGTTIDHISLTITKPLFYFSLFSLPIAIILAFVPRTIFNSWLKFSAWAIPLLVIYIWTTPVNSNAFMDLFPFYRDDAARLAGEVFAGVSLLLIIWKYFSARRR